MNDKIQQIIIMELASDKLKLEIKLEKILNSEMEVFSKINSIKEVLREIAISDNVFTTWQNYTTPSTDVDNENNDYGTIQ